MRHTIHSDVLPTTKDRVMPGDTGANNSALSYLRLPTSLLGLWPTWVIAIISAILIISLAACGSPANAEPVPPEIYYGQAVCEFCGMIVSEERFAGGFITADGQNHIFDDLGDLAQAHVQHAGQIVAIFVHDYDDHTWIKAETATFVRSRQLPTPMLSGMAAFAQAERAATFAAENDGEVLTFENYITYYWE